MIYQIPLSVADRGRWKEHLEVGPQLLFLDSMVLDICYYDHVSL